MIYENTLAVSSGVCLGRAVKLETSSFFQEEKIAKPILGERELIYKVINDYSDFLRKVECVNSVQREILNVQLVMLEDQVFIEKLIEKTESKGLKAGEAISSVCDELAESMANLDDNYFKERARDYLDIRKQLLIRLASSDIDRYLDFKENTVVFAENLSPSDTVSMNFKNVVGIVTSKGGLYSHVSIIAQSLGIPCIIGAKDAVRKVKTGQEVVLDADKGEIYLSPSKSQLDYYKKRFMEEKKTDRVIEEEVSGHDGKKVSVFANIASEEELEICLKNGCDGIGLLRTEFLFMDRDKCPDEEEQYQVYKSLASRLKGKMLTVRTLDIGGDKPIPYISLAREDNPFLGLRGLRLSFKYIDIFKSQLRAVLRAGYMNNISILIPFVISVAEVKKVKEILEECKNELDAEGKNFAPNIELGIMIETPASVLCAEALIDEVDFFSIGTNDLTQYLLAVDRGNSEISRLYDSYHPSVLKSIKIVIDASHNKGKKVSMCGQMASDTRATKLLLEMGLDKFSVSASKIQEIKRIIIDSKVK